MWPIDDRVVVLPAPLQTLAAVRVYDEAGEAETIDLETFMVDTISAPGVVWVGPLSVPGPGRRHGGIELDIVAGYGGAALNVPPSLKAAIRVLVAYWYENRGVVTGGSATPMIAEVAALLAPYRVLSL
jgi:uncharacterized phiE125 gp8 family phage protein